MPRESSDRATSCDLFLSAVGPGCGLPGSASGGVLSCDHERHRDDGVDANTISYAAKLGYKVVGWDIDPKDWRRPGAATIASSIIQRAISGTIVVLHDGGGANQQTVVAVETILQELGQQGYIFPALP